MLSLGNIQTPAFQTAASGACPTSQDFFDVVNQVIPRLLNRGDWPGTTMPIRVLIKNGCVTWPRYVGQVRNLNSCRGGIPVQSVWHEFLPYQGPRHIHGWETWRGRERRLVNQFQSPVYNDIYGPNCYVRLYCDLPQDAGVSITIFGTDNNNQFLQTINADGSTSIGATFTVQAQTGPGGQAFWGSTSVPVSRIDRIVVGKTQGMKRLYAYDATQNALYDLAIYEPSETDPSYVRQQLDGEHRHLWSSGCQSCGESVIALVKLKYVPVSCPTDGLILLDGAQGAILHGFRAVKREEAGDSGGATGFWKMAVEEMNRMLEDFDPEGPAVTNEVFAGRTFRNKCF